LDYRLQKTLLVLIIDQQQDNYMLLGLLEFILLMRKVVLQLLLGSTVFSPYSWANASLDFNPTVDRIRLVTASGQNLRLHPELGTVVATDGSINGELILKSVP
jgi:hypothetical protein